jgi:hypothetical protein
MVERRWRFFIFLILITESFFFFFYSILHILCWKDNLEQSSDAPPGVELFPRNGCTPYIKFTSLGRRHSHRTWRGLRRCHWAPRKPPGHEAISALSIVTSPRITEASISIPKHRPGHPADWLRVRRAYTTLAWQQGANFNVLSQ